MRASNFFLALVLFGFLAAAANAQPPGQEGILFGWDETAEHVADLPPEVQAEIRQALDEDLSFNVGFVYRRAFVFHERFALWTWKGRFALFDGDNVMEVPPADLERVLGAERYRSLPVPREYRWPVGLVSFVTIVLVLGALFYFIPTQYKRVTQLLKDPKYLQAREIYSASLPKEDDESTLDHRKQALDTAIDFLVDEKSVPRQKAAANLRAIISYHEELHSKQLRQAALAAEMAGDWNEALDLYEEAAELRELWDPKDFSYLQKCIARVEQKAKHG